MTATSNSARTPRPSRQASMFTTTALDGTSAAALAGMTEAAYCAQRLRTFEQRTGRQLTPAQRAQLEACEAMRRPARSGDRDVP